MKEELYYSRQIRLPEVGKKGQKKLKNSSILVIGAGGLGSPALQYLCAAGIGNITICDYDKVDISNLHRQTLFSYDDIGTNKALAAQKELHRKNPFISIHALTNSFAADTDISSYNLIIDCTDNFKTKFLAHDKCYQLKKKYIQASIYKYEGQIQVFDFEKFNKNDPCLRCLYPEIPKSDCVQSCEQIGVLGALPGVFGSMQAFEAIKLLLGQPTLKNGETLLLNLLDFSSHKLKWPKNHSCSVCCHQEGQDRLFQYENTLEEESFKKSLLISFVDELPKLNNNIYYLDTKQDLSQILKLPKETYITVVCAKGIRSFDLMINLQSKGFFNTYSLKNGINYYRSTP